MLQKHVFSFLLLLMGPAIPLLAGTPAGSPHQNDDPFTLNEDCMECHDDIPEYTEKTLHSSAFKVDCTDCHGDNEDHIDDPLPENIFMPQGKSGEGRCLSCHESDPAHHFTGATHNGPETACSDCHQIHATLKAPPHLLNKPADQLCLSCHGEVGISLNKPYTHRLDHGSMSCTSCHPIHGAPTEIPGFSFNGEAACLSCHKDLQGPFMFDHVSPTGTCTDCHQPHGSSNPKQLTRARVADLCLECHSSSGDFGLGSQPPAIHDMRSPRYQNCTTCHTAIHGSHQSPMLLK